MGLDDFITSTIMYKIWLYVIIEHCQIKQNRILYKANNTDNKTILPFPLTLRQCRSLAYGSLVCRHPISFGMPTYLLFVHLAAQMTKFYYFYSDYSWINFCMILDWNKFDNLYYTLEILAFRRVLHFNLILESMIAYFHRYWETRY